MKLINSVVVLAGALALGGCATIEQTRKGDVDKISAFPLTHRNEVEKLDLAVVIVEHAALDGRGAAPKCDLALRSLALLENDETEVGGKRLDQALGCFADAAALNPDRARDLRNQIQERMLGASEQRCADFKSHLQRSQSTANFYSGMFTSGFAAAGAITKSIEGARTLAGLSGLANATGAEFNQAYFANLAAHIVVGGIDQARSKLYEQIATSASNKTITEYTLQAAIKDAFRYHGTCSIMTGLIEAQDAIRLVDNPGLEALRRAVVKNKHLQALTAAEPDKVRAVIEEWKDVMPPDRWLAGVPLAASTRPVVSDVSAGPLLVQRRLVDAGALVPRFDASVIALEKDVPSFAVANSPAKLKTTALKKSLSDAVDAVKPKIDACNTPMLNAATEAISLTAQLANVTDPATRDKLDINVKYQNAARQALSASVDQFGAGLNACSAQVHASINALKSASTKPASDQGAAIAKIGDAPSSCVTVAALPFANNCPKP
jgi:hypothetical protein